jgi:hypothetical protein
VTLRARWVVVFAQLEAAAGSAGTSHARRLALLQLSVVVHEAAPCTATPLGMPFQFHERCRVDFQRDYLQVSPYLTAVSTLRATGSCTVKCVCERELGAVGALGEREQCGPVSER